MRLIKNRQEVLNCLPTCYACSAQKTSMEHVPPRCFFPDDRDEKGMSLYRKDLIKVPSCAVHNSEKSDDDVYALWHTAAQHGINYCGQMMLKELKRLAQKDQEQRGGKLLKLIESQVMAWDAEGRPLVKLDGERMMNHLRLMARGIYFAHTFEKLLVPLRVANISNICEPSRVDVFKKREQFFASELGNSEIFGANPEVFNYSICNRPGGVILIQLVFYGTAKSWVFHLPPNREKDSLLWVP